MKPLAIVTDIEGTTSSIRFIRDVLFVYAERFLPDYVREHKDERDVARQLRGISDKTGITLKDTEGLVASLQQWMRDGKQVNELKILQGMVWEEGYRKSEFQAHVYPDVPEKLREWLEREINLYVYSSGAEKAQRLYFRYSSQGDLRLMFAGYFDTAIGPREEVDSYRSLAAGVALEPQQMLFISDTEAELDAAREAGMHTLRVVRPEEIGGSPEQVESAHPVVNSFSEINLDSL
ncbi:MAG: acireductone synthase [Pseudohongiellaceae bacterium]